MSNEKRKTIGRQLNTQASIAEMTDTGRNQGVPEIHYPDD